MQKSVATNTATVDADQVVKLLTMLQNTIASQNKAIEDLQKQVARVEAQNKKLIDRSHQLAEPESMILKKNKRLIIKIRKLPKRLLKNKKVSKKLMKKF